MHFDWGVLIPLLAIGAWASIVLYRMHLAGRTREHFHRERLAMIEKGLVPPPESDPQQFERLMDPSGRYRDRPRHSRRVGLILVAVGLGISLQGYLPGGSHRGWGSGLILLFIGFAFLLNAMFEAKREP